MLQTVIGSPVKGGGAPAAIDDDEEMPQIQPFMPMLPPAESEAGPSQPMVDSPDEMPDGDDLLIVACDADGDGATTRKELDDCVRASFVKSAGPADATMGYIGYADWQVKWLGDQGALPSPFEVDRNGDNRISLDELQAQFAKLFARFDKNGDGGVTRAEALTVRATAASGRDRPPNGRPRGERVPGADAGPCQDEHPSGPEQRAQLVDDR